MAISDIEDRISEMRKFVQESRNSKLVLVTSGGTKVRLDKPGIRYIENFSTGTRGCNMAMRALMRGFNVVFLYRVGSRCPLKNSIDIGDSIRRDESSDQYVISSDYVMAVQNELDFIAKYASHLLAIQFEFVDEYLTLLKRATINVHFDLVCLCAAVSDFYIADDKLASEKVHSENDDYFLR
ncbi:hypothetical protein ACOME3_009234 [Neoechinorhynchus agilis]